MNETYAILVETVNETSALKSWRRILATLEATGIVDTPHLTLAEAIAEAKDAIAALEADELLATV